MIDVEYPQGIRFRYCLLLKPWRLIGSRVYGKRFWEVYANRRGYAVCVRSIVNGKGYTVYFYPDTREAGAYLPTRGSIMNKYIQAVKARTKKGRKGAVVGDSYLCDGRPALTAFLTETGEKEDDTRELSALMIAHADDGVRVGLKDDDCGGWLWRAGKTLADGLDAIEKALQDGSASFGGSKDRKGRRGVK